MNYVSYYRVSTKAQGQSGLGLEAQRSAVLGYVKEASLIVAEYTDVESGKEDSRPELLRAIARAKQEKARLVIAKLDRLSRNAAFIFTLRDAAVDFVCADMPDANTLTIGIFATLAQHERELISSRTKAALTQKKDKGEKLGPHRVTINQEVWLKGAGIRKLQAKENQANRRASGYIRALREGGKLSYRQIAARLNEEGFRTSEGFAFQATSVKRLYDRAIQPPSEAPTGIQS